MQRQKQSSSHVNKAHFNIIHIQINKIQIKKADEKIECKCDLALKEGSH